MTRYHTTVGNKKPFPCPVCGEPLERHKKNTGNVPFYDCNNPDCPVIEVHAHYRNGKPPIILRIKQDSIASNRQRGKLVLEKTPCFPSKTMPAQREVSIGHAKSSRKRNRR